MKGGIVHPSILAAKWADWEEEEERLEEAGRKTPIFEKGKMANFEWEKPQFVCCRSKKLKGEEMKC